MLLGGYASVTETIRGVDYPVWVGFMDLREDEESEIRMLIWRGLLATARYAWRKYSYFRGPMWLYLSHQIDTTELVDKIINKMLIRIRIGADGE